MICVGATKKSPASREVPALSLTVTFVPSNDVGNGTVEPMATPVAKFVPKAATMDSGASSFPRKLAADTVATAGTPPVIVKFCAAVTPPPGVGVNTVTGTIPPVAMRLAGTVAVNCVELTNTVAKSWPLQRILELATKFVPVAVKVNAGPPALVELGLMVLSVGAGFCPAVMLKMETLEVPPPGAGLTTVMLAWPCPTKSEA